MKRALEFLAIFAAAIIITAALGLYLTWDLECGKLLSGISCPLLRFKDFLTLTSLVMMLYWLYRVLMTMGGGEMPPWYARMFGRLEQAPNDKLRLFWRRHYWLRNSSGCWFTCR